MFENKKEASMAKMQSANMRAVGNKVRERIKGHFMLSGRGNYKNSGFYLE